MYTYNVEKVEHVTDSTLLLTLRKREGEGIFSFLPGQYAAISFKRGMRPSPARCFSILSSPTDHASLQFSMRERGHFTRALGKLKEGDTVKVRGPFGGFVLDTSRDINTVLLAGGIGVTPFISMARYATALRASNNVTLVYSCQNQDDIPFLEELKDLQVLNPQLKVMFVIAEGPVDKLAGQHVAMGMINQALLDSIVENNYEQKTFFICGPPPFMHASVGALKARHVNQHHIITEAFAQGSHRQTGKVQSWPYNVYALSAISLAVGSFIIMLTDFIKTLPPNSMISVDTQKTKPLLTSNRQADLDSMVNNLPANPKASSDSSAVTTAYAAVEAANKTVATKPSSTTPTSTTTTQPAAVVTPQKQCTTTQSGKTICV